MIAQRRNPIDGLRTEQMLTFEQAVAIQRRAFEHERREAQRDHAAMLRDPELAPMARIEDVTFWDDQVERGLQAVGVYRTAISAAVAAMRLAGLDEYADALESGDYAAHLAF